MGPTAVPELRLISRAPSNSDSKSKIASKIKSWWRKKQSDATGSREAKFSLNRSQPTTVGPGETSAGAGVVRQIKAGQENLLPKLSGGDPNAAQECLDRYGRLIWSLARRRIRNTQEAEDAVQEIFLAIWKNADRFDPAKASEPTFVTMIARRRLIDLYRRKERQPHTSGSEEELAMLPGTLSETLEHQADAKLALRVMKDLDEKERRVILLSVYQGMSHSEISKHTDIPLGTVKTYIRRGLQRVRASLEKGPSRPGGSGE